MLLLTDLSKVFDCLNHQLLIAKLNAYDNSLTSLRLVHNYLSNKKTTRKKSIVKKLTSNYIWGSTRFNSRNHIIQYLIDLFFVIKATDIASYANNNIPYVTVDNTDRVIESLEEVS